MKKVVIICIVMIVVFSCAGCIKFAGAEEDKDSLEFTIKEYKEGNTTGKMLVVSNVKDKTKEDKINRVLEEDARAVLSPYDLSNEKVTVTMDLTYEYEKDSNRLIVFYKGVYNNTTAAHPTAFYAISIVDLENGTRSNVISNVDIDKVITVLLSGKYTIVAENDDLKNAQREYLNGLTKEDYNQLFQSINFQEVNGVVTMPQVFMVNYKDRLTVVLPTIHALGDYIEASILEEDMK